MRNQIYGTYDMLRQSLVGDLEQYDCDPGFYDIVVNRELQCSATEDQDLMKLAVMSSLKEWGGALYITPLGQKEVLHYLCLELVMDGEDFFKISSKELAMLRKDILTASDDYAILLANLAEIENELSVSESLDLLILRAQAAMKLFRYQEMKDSLDRMKAYSEDPFGEIHLAVWTALLYTEVIFATNIVLIDETSRLKEAVALFQANHDYNRKMGCYDPVVYTDLWIQTIYYYIFYLDCELSTDEFEQISMAPKVISPDMFPRVTPEFINQGGPEVLSLMKKHDELILQNLVCSIDGCKYQPYFRRTEQTRQQNIMTGQYHSRLERILKDQPRVLFKTPFDLSPAKIDALLHTEFSN